MKRAFALLFALSLLLVLGIGTAAAQGIIVPGVDTDPSTLKIDYHHVDVEIDNQIATTNVDFQFTNEGQRLAEGTLVFPLPAGAAVDNLTMWVDGQPIEARILDASEARQVYNDIVRRMADPALLEYVGTNAVQASIFPIAPGASRRVQISYSQVLEVDNGLIHYVYPLNAAGTVERVVGEMSINVHVVSNDEISTVYSPSHNIAISRASDNRSFRAGYEANRVIPDTDFSLYYGIVNDAISVNLLTYRESADQEGFFMLLVQPPFSVPEDQVIPKDVIIVLDQSGSMEGSKWDQARDAAAYVLQHLNPGDHFNVITFSTGWRIYSNNLETTDQAQGAIDWIHGLYAEGGTDINGALETAMNMAHPERPTTILFLTDGLATEGITDSDKILANLRADARPNVRIFTFGVGDDVDTFLLDAIVRDHRGTSTYVRPSERIDEEVASLYNKISAPVLTDIALDFGGVTTELVYPQQLPDLFAGEQLTLVGRYRGDASNVTITLTGTVHGQQQTFTYAGQNFPPRAGGEPFIARLWATRRIGELLNNIRLNGENQELVDSVVSLSIRYGIITPYTSFLIEENDILTQSGRDRAATSFAGEAENLAAQSTGANAVSAADMAAGMSAAEAPMVATPMPMPTMTAQIAGVGGGQAAGAVNSPPPGNEGATSAGYQGNAIQTVNDKTFILLGGVWTDTTFEPDTMETQKVTFLSDAYFTLLDEKPELSDYFALGDRVIVVLDGTAYEVVVAE